MDYRRWQISRAAPDTVQALVQALDIAPLTAQVLAVRGYGDTAAAVAFLQQYAVLSDPMLMRDMDKLVQRVHRAVDTGERIVVFGDYDVDGVTATALLLEYLESVGATVFYKLPSRTAEGYGLNRAAVELLARKKVGLVITVDNGISAVEEIAYATECGIDVIITDHHLPPAVLPAALAVVDPLRTDDDSPAKNLSGVGVAFKVICALEGCTPEELLPYYGDLVAVGTVADMMPLTGENRTLVRQGLECLAQTQHVGLAALLEGCGLADKPLTADNVSYALAPRLNAAGRMEDAAVALDLLLCEDEEEAAALVAQLNDYNAQRQTVEQEIVNQLAQQLEADSAALRHPVLVVCGEAYHHGVIGIVASRLAERFGRPAIVCTKAADGTLRGSGRSQPGFSLHAAIAACKDLLVRWGGHDQAAGLTMDPDNLPEFIRRINAYAADCHIETPPLLVDGVFDAGLATAEAVAQLELLAPFGTGNPAPLFILENARIEAVYPLSEGRHTRLKLNGPNGGITAALFGTPPAQLAYRVGDVVDVVVSLSVWQGTQQAMVSGRIRAMRPSGLGEDYIEDWLTYSRFLAGASLTREERQRLCPTREDVVRVWREVGVGGVAKADVRPMLLRCAGPGGAGAGKMLTALAILQELAHIAPQPDTGHFVPTGGAKRPLSESALLRELEKEGV